jgi:hypothetical protein
MGASGFCRGTIGQVTIDWIMLIEEPLRLGAARPRPTGTAGRGW